MNRRSWFHGPGSGFSFLFLFLFLFTFAVAACTPTSPQQAATSHSWIVSDAGVGPIAMGMRGDDLEGIVDSLGTLGECVYVRPRGREEILIMLVDGIVARVDVIGPSVATAEGARVGDSEARVRELYPSARTEPHKYTDGHYLTIDTQPGRRLVFETDGTKVTRYRSGAVPQVDWVEGCS